MTIRRLTLLASLTLLILVTLGMPRSAAAAESLDPIVGKCKWSWTTQDGEKRESVLTVEKREGKFAGTLNSPMFGVGPVSDLKLNKEEVSFKVVRERDGNTFEINYKGALKGDSIKGQIQVGDNNREWDAKREPKDQISGLWKWTFEMDGRSINSSAKLKFDGQKVTGTSIRSNGDEVEIKEGTFKDGKVQFVVVRERDGVNVKVTYEGRLEGDVITGKMIAKWDGDERELDWNAKRSKD